MINVNSKILIVCQAYKDGWAYAKTLADNKTWVIKPPYKLESFVTINETSVASAVCKHGFSCADLPEKPFSNLAELIQFLEKKYVEEHRQHHTATEDSAAIKQLIHFAPKEIIIQYLDAVENELIPNQEINAAKKLLADLLTTQIIKNDPTLQERIKILQETILKL